MGRDGTRDRSNTAVISCSGPAISLLNPPSSLGDPPSSSETLPAPSKALFVPCEAIPGSHRGPWRLPRRPS